MSKLPFACVIGNPVAHSLSPVMHNAWLAHSGIRARYQHQQFPQYEFAEGMARLAQDPDFLGANVTLPFKEAALDFADHQSKIAERVGAANLLVRQANGSWHADNTDVQGFLAPLQWHGGRQKSALVFGAGGAARSVVLALHMEGYDRIGLCNRTDIKAETLLADLDIPGTEHVLFARRNDPGFAPGLLVNAGSAGMKGFEPLDVELRGFETDMLVYDLVYAPMKTPLLAQAQALRMPIIGGLSMLIEQARPSFTALYGKKPPKDVDMHAVLLAHLEAQA